jgi:acyl-CoA thioester hydrolase
LIYTKKRINLEYIDCNQHVSESSYYKIAIDVLQGLHQELGLNDLFANEQTAPIVFSSNIEFFREVFVDEEVTIAVVLFPKSPDFRKWQRLFEIYNQADELSAKIISQGAFFDLRTRKVKAPSLGLYEAFKSHNLVTG